jgi:hypothetical protein
MMLGVMMASYSYGFYRSWTLPIWNNEYTKYRSDIPIRFCMSNVMGIVYVIPPFSLIKYWELFLRLYDVYCPKSLYYKSSIKQHGDHWREWGFYHPRVL